MGQDGSVREPGSAAGRRRRQVMSFGAVIAAVALIATACVGSVDRAEFDRMVRERGGGLSQALVLDAVEAVGEDQGVDPVLIETIVATSENVSVTVVNPDFSDELDRYTFRNGDLNGPDPVNQGSIDIQLPELPDGVTVPDSVRELLDEAGAVGGDPASVFGPDDVALDRLDEMVDRAIETAALRGGYATSLAIAITAGTRPQIRVDVTNERRSAGVVFGPRGRLLEVS
jgi:hypothetical protein